MNIRPATLADIPWLLELGSAAQQEAPHYAAFHGNDPDRYKRIVLLLQHPALVFVGVCNDNSGFICGSLEPTIWFEETVASANLLYVMPEKRGTSRAWRLLAAFEKWGRAQGASRILTGVSSGINEELVGQFYEKMGYIPQGMCYYKEV